MASGDGDDDAALCMMIMTMMQRVVVRLRNVVRRQKKDLRARMLEVSREEAERKRMLDERANYRFWLFFFFSICPKF